MKKTYIQANCLKKECKHWKDPCCQVCTEVVEYTKGPVDLMFIGMGAGKNEDINSNPRNTRRQPWVGRAGKYLRSMIKYLWETLELEFNVALSNTVRCHPKNEYGRDRAPTVEEEFDCEYLLSRDIESIKPLVLVPCGASASINVCNYPLGTSMGSIHGIQKMSRYTITSIPTYHASYLTRQYGHFKPEEKNSFDVKVIADILRALKISYRTEGRDVSTLETIARRI